MALLEVQGLGIAFGGVHALQNVSFTVAVGSIHGLIGPNGSGKTTTFNCISRLLAPGSGSIRFDGGDLLAVAPHDVVRRGIARTFQNLALCANLSALDNVLLGLYHRGRLPALAYGLRLPAAVRAEGEQRREAMALLEQVGCAAVAAAPVRGLPYGVLKRVELARALAARPRLLILDEPAAGVSSGERDELARLIRDIQVGGITVLLVEHDMALVMSLCQRVTVLDFGQVIADGPPEQVSQDAAVIAAYLGVGEESDDATA